jgi:PAS domain S-box-containing protein
LCYRNAAEVRIIVDNLEAHTDHLILLIGPEAADAETIRTALADTRGWAFSIEWVRNLSTGITRLRTGPIDAVLLDLILPDGQGLQIFDRICQTAPDVPILIICDPGDESLAIQGVQRGAQDYLLKTWIDQYSLPHAIRNMIERKAIAEALFVEQARAEVTLNSIGDAVLSTDIVGHITYLNVAAERMTGWSRQDATGRPLAEVFHIIDEGTREPATNPMARAVREDRPVGGTPNCVLVRRDGTEAAIEDAAAPIHDRRGRVTGAVIVFHDVSSAREMALRMSHLTHHDPLTDLPNRLLLHDRLTQAIELGRRHRRQLAVLFVDVDRFKHINDSLGREVGDHLLRLVAAQLTKCVRTSDTISRQGGDEFVIMLAEIESDSGRHRGTAARRRPRTPRHGEHRRQPLPG